jgi:hypothetical protein
MRKLSLALCGASPVEQRTNFSSRMVEERSLVAKPMIFGRTTFCVPRTVTILASPEKSSWGVAKLQIFCVAAPSRFSAKSRGICLLGETSPSAPIFANAAASPLLPLFLPPPLLSFNRLYFMVI